LVQGIDKKQLNLGKENQVIFITLIAFIISMIVLEKIMINKFNIQKKKGLYKYVNEFHKWSEAALIIALIIIIFSNIELRRYFFPIFLVVLFGFRAFIEWKFEKESKVYILSILSGSAALSVWIILDLFL